MPVIVPHLIVEVFEHSWFRGRKGTVIKSTPFTGDIGFQDNISSVKIYKGPAFEKNTKYKAIFYENINFQGRHLALGPGYYVDINDVAHKFGDRISSINFAPIQEESGPEWGNIPLIIEVFRDPDFKGRKAVVLRDVQNTERIGLQDSISSVRILKGTDCPRQGCEVIFYADPNFGGAALPIRIGPEDNRKNIPNLHILPKSFGDKISSIKVEGWSSSGEFTETAWQDEFDSARMKAEWTWIDPEGGGSWEERKGYLELKAEPGLNLQRGENFDAPRLIVATTGDFAIETQIHVHPKLEDHGGLLVWRNESTFLRLEKTSGAHEYKGDVVFVQHRWRPRLIGRVSGMQRVLDLYLRIERRGNELTGYASADGVAWTTCGVTLIGMGETVEVGLFGVSPGEKEKVKPTTTRFDYFRLLRRKGELKRYDELLRDAPGKLSETERIMALRSLM